MLLVKSQRSKGRVMLNLTPVLSRCAAVALCILVSASMGRAQDLVMADDPEKILEIARGFGSAEMETDGSGDPIIRARMEGTTYSILFFGCEGGVNCTSIQFWTYLSPPEDALVAVNAWNRDIRFGKAYIDGDGDVVIEMDVNLWGGVAPKNLDDTFDWWRAVLDRVDKEFSETPKLPLFPFAGEDGKSL
jgi:Putative bacterial sensory transduction regulator